MHKYKKQIKYGFKGLTFIYTSKVKFEFEGLSLLLLTIWA